MAQVLVSSEKLDAIVDSVNSKAGTTAKMKLDDVPTAIENIPDTYKKIVDSTGSADYLIYRQPITSDLLNELLKYNDTENATSATYMFSTCSKLTTIPLINISKVTNCMRMFYNCSALESLPELDFSTCTSLNYTFSGCSSLSNATILTSAKNINLSYAFQNCTALETIYLNTYAVTTATYAFSACTSLKTIVLTRYNCSGAANYANMFNGDTVLEKLIIKSFSSNQVFGTSMFTRCPSTMQIYVPDDLIDTLKEATGWSSYADRMYKLSDLPDEDKDMYGIVSTTNVE